MRVAVTGATGFVGRQVVSHLLARGVAVRALVRDLASAERLPVGKGGRPAEVVPCGDLFALPAEEQARLLSGIDTVIHAAWYAEPGKYLTSPINVACLVGTLRLAEAFRDAGGKRFVGVGTCAEYDLGAGLLRTTTPLRPTVLYAACKASAFQVLQHLLPAGGVSFAWCRLFYLHGEGEDPRRLVPYLRQRLAAGEPAELTSGNQIRDFLDVKDAAARIVEVALGDATGPVNVCSGVPVTVRQLAERIADEHGRRDLLRFGARADNPYDPPCVVGVREEGTP
jgi:dTDP-6-deoxy-L-talose 4-dehydrogenase (NAD+)